MLNISLNLLLIPRLQVWGAAIATVCSFAFLFICVFPIAQHLYRIPYEYGRLAKLTVAAVGLYVIAYYVNPANVYISLAVKFLIAFSYPLVLYVIGFYTPAERDKARELFGRLMNIIRKKKADSQ